jgi:alginate O-acetyltransferase complex protein AlgI
MPAERGKVVQSLLFTTPAFLFAFLPITLFIVGMTVKLLGKTAGMVALIAASVVFYGNWRPSDLWIIGSSITINFIIANLLSKPDSRFRLIVLWAGIIVNIAVLAFYKYTNFFLLNLGENPINIPLPLAISFYSFQQIAFIVDIYHCRIGRIPLLNYVVTVLFFPHLIAGPLIHYQAIMDQFERRFSVSAYTIWCGLPIFTIGLAKKIALADTLSTIVNPLFKAAQTAPLEFFSAWIAALGYTAQLYFDFSGYSDMAIGLGIMFGIVLPLNFFSPYKATSIIDFWRRWHMTLSAFLREYLYIPLGGRNVSPPHRYANLLVVMLLGGLWHGAGWTYVFWGGLHGAYLVINHLWRNNVRIPPKINAFLLPGYATLTLLAVVFAWVFFRASSFTAAQNLLKGAAGMTFASLPGEIGYFVALHNGSLLGVPCNGLGLTFATMILAIVLLALAYVIVFFLPNVAQMFALREPDKFWTGTRQTSISMFAQAVAIGAALWVSAFGVLGAVPSEFLYFQF